MMQRYMAMKLGRIPLSVNSDQIVDWKNAVQANPGLTSSKIVGMNEKSEPNINTAQTIPVNGVPPESRTKT
jgi:hypothetical protein